MDLGSIIGTVTGGGSAFANNLTNASLVKESNYQNRREAETNRDWQESMSSSALQRRRIDAIKAGINPILAMADGVGANMGSGAQAQVQAPQIDGLLGINIAKTAMEMKKMNEETKATKLSNDITEKTKNDLINSITSAFKAEMAKNKNLQGIYGSKRGKLLEWLNQTMNPLRGIIGGSVSAGTSSSTSTVTKK